MSSLATFSIRNNLPNKFRSLAVSFITMILLLSGCSQFELPNETEEGSELSLASRIERVASAPTAFWDADDREIVVRGAGIARSNVAISNGVTGQFIGAAAFNTDDDDDDDRNRSRLVLNNITAVPCSIQVQVRGRTRTVIVRNAPANCVGTTNSIINTTLLITKAKWRNSSNKLTVKGDGAIPRQLVSVFDGITGQLLGTDQANTVGKWKVKVRNLALAPCTVTVVSGDHSTQRNVANAGLSCGNIPGSFPGTPNFNQAPDGAIIGPIADMAISIGSSVNFFGSGFDPDSNLGLNYQWDFDFPNSIDPSGFSTLQNPTATFSQAGVYRVTLTVTDAFGLSDPTPDTRVIVVQPSITSNQAPIGSILSPATNVEINAGGFVNFAGMGTDVDGVVTSYIWNFAGGAANSSLQNPGNVVFSTPGVYLVSLTVVDATGVADTTPEYVAITVRGGNTGTPNNNPTNSAPNGEIVSPATDITIAAGTSFNFSGTAFDVDGNSPLKYYWNFAGASPNSSQINPGFITFDQPGVYTVSLTVTDSLGMSDLSPSTRVITVTGGGNGNNLAPESVITLPSVNTTINAGQAVDFMGSGSDPDNNQPLSFFWNFGGAAASSNLQNPGSINFSNPGIYIVSLTVTDSLGTSDATSATRIITVLPGNNIPGSGNNNVNLPPESFINSPAANMTINVGQEIEFTGSGSDPENDSPIIYSWDFDGAAPKSMVQNPGKFTFNQAGSYRIRLMVKDAMGNNDPTPAERIITVNNPFISNIGPISDITLPLSSQNIEIGGVVNFAGNGSDQDGAVVEYLWDFGGAAPESSLQNPGAITFNQSGIFKVSLYVKDNAGFYSNTPDVRFITVTNTANINQAPIAKIVSPITDVVVNAGDSILFSGVGEDPDNFGNALNYSWNFSGIAANSSQAVPGLIQFMQPGTYTVSLSVMDNFGLTNRIPELRTITVVDNSPNNIPPVISMNTASLRPNVNVGESLIFSANATGITPGPMSYSWNFDGAAPDSNLQNPGAIAFTKPGIYKVSVYARDAFNKRSNLATYTITAGIPSTFSSAPNGTIVIPTTNVAITLGDTLNFMGTGSDIDTTSSLLMYRWNFDGVAASSHSQNPGNVTFNQVGTFNVTLTVSDNTGATDTSPAIRTITVSPVGSSNQNPGPGNGPGNNQRPNGSISSPIASVTNIAAGQSVVFSASATDSDNNLPVAYRWSFGNGMSDVFVQNPGQIVFPNPGIYSVSLVVTDSLGLSDNTPDVRTIVVGNVGGGVTSTNAPNGIIEAPASAVTISRGQSIYFSASATDPNGDPAISYMWDFNGGAVNSTQQIPGNVVFSNPGQFIVKLTATNSSGMVDQTPMVRVITVLP